MAQITFYKHEPIPLEMHKVRIVQKLNYCPPTSGFRRCGTPVLTRSSSTTAISSWTCSLTPASMP